MPMWVYYAGLCFAGFSLGFVVATGIWMIVYKD
jgi:hypothetical protein